MNIIPGTFTRTHFTDGKTKTQDFADTPAPTPH